MNRRFGACLLFVSCCTLLVAAQVTVSPVPVSEGVMEERLIHRVTPQFPTGLGPSVQGPVVLRAVIDKAGNITSLQVISGHSMLVAAAIEAVKRWKYKPYLLHGSAVEVQTTIELGYLRMGVTPSAEAADSQNRTTDSGAAGQSAESATPSAESQARIQAPPNSVPTFLVQKVAPVYPPLARQARIQGTVVLRIVIDKEGAVRDPQIVSGHPMLSPAAIEAVKQWRYRRNISDDKPVEVETVVRVSFRMADGPEVQPPLRSPQGSAPREGIPQLARVSAGIMQGLLEHKVDPEYPADAKEKHIDGTVVLNVDIDNEGNVGRIELVSGHPMLAPAAMDAVLDWKYRPFVLNGAPTAVETTVQVKFVLAGE